MRGFVIAVLLMGIWPFESVAEGELEISVFVQDVTPPMGTPLCYSYINAAERVEEPLTARGVVIFGEEKPIVLCVADYVGIANESHDAWREALAKAAGTSPERVAMHVIHNHDSPGADLSAMRLLDDQGLKDVMHLRKVHDEAIINTAATVREAMKARRKLTHVGMGVGFVKKFASNRRIIGENGKLKMGRMSSSRNEAAIAAPEGTIDPEMSLISFWDGDEAVAVLTFYASHPQSFYGKGGLTPDTVGVARNRRTEKTGTLHVHFAGAGGDVAAGKYNDGSPEARAALTDRAEAGMKEAWDSQKKMEVKAGDVGWLIKPVELPWRGLYTEEELTDQLASADATARNRIRAARDLVFYRRWKEGRKIDLNCLRLGEARVLFYPGELFVKYQLAAKQMAPEEFVAVAAYGDGGPGYIGTAIAYEEGGYEVSRVSRTAPSVEKILLGVTGKLLNVED